MWNKNAKSSNSPEREVLSADSGSTSEHLMYLDRSTSFLYRSTSFLYRSTSFLDCSTRFVFMFKYIISIERDSRSGNCHIYSLVFSCAHYAFTSVSQSL